MSIFRVVVLGIFVVFIVLAVLVFSGIIGGGNGDRAGVGGEVVMWGTLDAQELDTLLSEVRIEYSEEFRLTYVQKRASTFDRDLVEALASGTGPDLILLPENLIVRHDDKILPVPYESISERRFKDTYIEEGELYLRDEGILALPFVVDPMVLYWNRDIFSSEGLAQPPSYWDELFTLAPTLTKKDQNLTITRSAIALGEYQNILHAKDILGLFMIQAGDPLVAFGDRGLESVLGDKHGFVEAPAVSALRFYTEFSNSSKEFYSWNRALPLDRDYFAAGNLALYVGYGSESSLIEAQNPNLNFDVVRVPQVRDAGRFATQGSLTGIAVLKSSRNPQTAFYASFILTQPNTVTLFTNESALVPARRDLLSQRGVGATEEVFYNSALIARSWLDPNPEETEGVFQEMIENVVSGRSRLSEAISRGSANLDLLLR
jgi:ABC-type glycerol-3-phosphate transport system substrate-binding protein